MSGSGNANMKKMNESSSTSTGGGCSASVEGFSRCCCKCICCDCRGAGKHDEQDRSKPISVQNLVVNAYGTVQVNSYSSSGSYLGQQFPASADTAPRPYMAPSLQLLSQSPAYRNDQQIRQDTHRRFLENPEDYNLRLSAEPESLDEIETDMPDASDAMEFDDIDNSVRADRSSSIDELSVYEALFPPTMSSSAILVGTGGGVSSFPSTNPGNGYLVLTENRRYPAGYGRNGPLC